MSRSRAVSSAQDIDAIIRDMETALEGIQKAKGGMVKLRKAELNLNGAMERIRDAMLESLEASTGTDRQEVDDLFGGDCTRIARIQQCLEGARFTAAMGGEGLKETAMKACISVIDVLNDMGRGAKLKAAQEEVLRKAAQKEEAAMNETIASVNATLQEFGVDVVVAAPVRAEIRRQKTMQRQKTMASDTGTPKAEAEPPNTLEFTENPDDKIIDLTPKGEEVNKSLADPPAAPDSPVDPGPAATPPPAAEPEAEKLTPEKLTPVPPAPQVVATKEGYPTVQTVTPATGGYAAGGGGYANVTAAPAPVARIRAETEAVTTTAVKAAPKPGSKEWNRDKIIQQMSTGRLREICLAVFNQVDVASAQEIVWNTRQIPNFVKSVFYNMQIPIPTEREIYTLYTRFDADGSWSLNPDESCNLVEMLCCELYEIHVQKDREKVVATVAEGQVSAIIAATFPRYQVDDKLQWNTGGVRKFVDDVFNQLRIPLPSEEQMFALTKRFDDEGDMCLTVFEANHLVETMVRSIYQLRDGLDATTCPQSHVMTLTVIEKGRRIKCDVCGVIFNESQTMYGCRQCDYDACVSCTKTRRAQIRRSTA